MKNSEEQEKELKLRSFYVSAKHKLQNGKLEDAYNDFKKSENIFGCAYCLFLRGKIDEAGVLLNLIRNSSPAVNWLLCLISIIKGDNKEVPTFLQIRNFYEADLNMLIFYKNFDMAKKICMNLGFLARYNKEVYKLTARVLLDNGWGQDAVTYLKKSIDIYYKDPEVHFILAEAYLLLGDIEKAKKEYQVSNDVTNGYYPAVKKLRELK